MKTAVLVSLLALQTLQPGQMTQARVWVQNKGKAEAVPVDLREVNLDVPLNVHVVNGLPGTPVTAPVLTRQTRQTWEYETIVIPAGANAAALLNREGNGGWETTGIAFADADGTALLLKRPR
jgi:hypothetical protein